MNPGLLLASRTHADARRPGGRAPAAVLLALMAAAVGPACVDAATFNVGTGTGCQHASLQAAINAAETSPGPDTIRISRSLAYTQQALTVSTGQQLELLGGFATCADAVPDGLFTAIDGAGGATEPVLRISLATGGVVTLRYLTIRNGDEDGSGKGGGIYYRGNGSVQVRDSAITGNLAGLGGGVYAEGSGGDAELIIGENVTIAGNTARYNGGGVFAEALEMAMREPGSIIAFNEALGTTVNGIPVGGYGGGLVVNPTTSLAAYAYIAAPGTGSLGVVHGNTARYGGGIAVLAESGSSQNAYLELYSNHATQPVAVTGNFGSVAGGGLYLRSDGESIPYAVSFAVANLWNAILEDNGAPVGAAVYLAEDTKGDGSTTPSFLSFNEFRRADALPCPVGAPCGGILGNASQDAFGDPTTGALVHAEQDCDFQVGGDLSAGGVVFRDNRGGNLFRMEGGDDTAELTLDKALIVDNTVSGELIVAGTGTSTTIIDSTIAGNAIGATDVLRSSGSIALQRSILWQPGRTSLAPGASRTVSQVIASEVASLGGGPEAVTAEPRFVDPIRGNYRLRAASHAVDFAAPVSGDDRDADGRPRDQRIEAVPRFPMQVRDLGAFERPALQPLVLNADFDVDLHLWNVLQPGVVSWDGSQNASGPAGSGSATVNTSASATQRLVALAHCVHLPGPGTYALNGWGRAGAAITPLQRDSVRLAWEYRRNGSEACNAGPPDASGDHFLTAFNTWTRPMDPALIVVPDNEWNHTSSISVYLVVVDAGVTVPFQMSGWFDGITLDLGGRGPLLKDGFEDP